jgi:hypothetical protein
MDLKDQIFDRLVSLRERIGAVESNDSFSSQLDPRSSIEIKLETGGLEVKLEEIVRVGPFLTYKGETLAILYIYNSNNSKLDLESDAVDKSAPKFHFTWCKTLEQMTKKHRFDRYILSRSKKNVFKVEALEREPSAIRTYGERHELTGIELFSCQNCLNEMSYKGFAMRNPKPGRLDQVRHFSIEEFCDENDGNLAVMKFTPKYTDRDVPSGAYTADFVEISRRVREGANWCCSSCHVDMTNMKQGLHTHHISGVKSDNRNENLKVLCALCHKNIDQFHSTMFVKPVIEQFVLSNRR